MKRAPNPTKAADLGPGPQWTPLASSSAVFQTAAVLDALLAFKRASLHFATPTQSCGGSTRLLSEPGSQQQVGPVSSLSLHVPGGPAIPRTSARGDSWWSVGFRVLVFRDGWSVTEV